MKELKTLNDIDSFIDINGHRDSSGISKEKLKAEAVKDYKTAKKGNILDVLSYIRWKNNLTEADLK